MSVELQYAPTRRRRIRWRWVFVALLLIAAVFLWIYHKDLVAQARLRWALAQCRTYTRPADSIALEANTYHAAQLVGRDGSYALLPPRTVIAHATRTGQAYKSVPAWDTLSSPLRSSSPQAAYLRSMGLRVPAIPLFVHERTSKGRPARIVVVELGFYGLEGFVLAPGYPWQKPTVVWQGLTETLGESIPDTLARVHNLSIQLPPGQPAPPLSLRQSYGPDAVQPPAHIYFGQPDPNDPARFTIRVEIGKTPFDFKGQLMPDDTIQIEGPLLSDIFKKLSTLNGQ